MNKTGDSPFFAKESAYVRILSPSDRILYPVSAGTYTVNFVETLIKSETGFEIDRGNAYMKTFLIISTIAGFLIRLCSIGNQGIIQCFEQDQ